MTVFTQNNQTGIRLNARPSFMITDILAANNTTISAATIAAPPPPAPAQTQPQPLSPSAAVGPQRSSVQTPPSTTLSPEPLHGHPHHLQHHPMYAAHFMQQQPPPQLPYHHHPYHQHHQLAAHNQQHSLMMTAAAAKLMGGGGAGDGNGLEMRVPAAGLSPATDNDFDGSDDNEEDGDSSVCSNGTKDNDQDGESKTPGSASSGLLSGMRPSSKKQRKARTAFSDHQLHSLEKSFTRQKYLSVQDRMELAAKLGISDTQVKTWFQNRRTKWKRQTSVGFELLVEAGNYAAYQRAAAFRSGYPPGMDAGSAYLPPGYPTMSAPGAANGGAPSAAELYYRHHQQAASLAAMQHQQHQQQQHHQQQHQHHQQQQQHHQQLPPQPHHPHPAYSMYAAAAAAAAAAAMKPGGALTTAPFAYAPGSLARPTAQLPQSMPLALMAAAAAANVSASAHERRSISPVGSQHSEEEATAAAASAKESVAVVGTSDADDNDDDDESDIEV